MDFQKLEFRKDNLMTCGYKHRPSDTTTWMNVERKDGKTRAVSKILVFIDDIMNTIWKTYAGIGRIRNKLHADLRTKGLPPPPPPPPPDPPPPPPPKTHNKRKKAKKKKPKKTK